MAGGYGTWADRLQIALDTVTSTCRMLADERCGLFSESYRRCGWDTWRGSVADHFLQLITRLDRYQLQLFVEHLNRFRAELEWLHSEVRLAAQAEKANLPLPQGPDIDIALRPWREWPPTSVDLILGPQARGNVAKFNDRWEWIDKDMLPAYKRLGHDPERLQGLIDTPIAERAEKLRLIPLENRA